MNPSLVTRHSSLAAVLALMLFSASAMAQVGNDPTRPPAGLGVGVADSDMDDTGGGMVLQSVIISPTNKSAIISGMVVKLGEKYGDAVLVNVAENEVVLKSGTTSQVLKLRPGVEKRYSTSTAPKDAKRHGGARSKAPADGGTSPR